MDRTDTILLGHRVQFRAKVQLISKPYKSYTVDARWERDKARIAQLKPCTDFTSASYCTHKRE